MKTDAVADPVVASQLYEPRFPSLWEHRPLWSLAEWINGLAFRDIHFAPSGMPVIKIAELKNGVSNQTTFTEQIFDESIRVKAGDMVFSWSGQPETSIDVFWWRGPNGWLNQHIFRVAPGDVVDDDFFYYLLRYLRPNFIGIARNKQTTGLGHVTKRDLEAIRVAYPSVIEQRAIAAILGTLDDKIELNRQMNHTLEQIAQALFKSWFVDFDPVWAKKEGWPPFGMDADTAALFPDEFEDSELGLIPAGWGVGAFSSSIDILSGGTPKTRVPEYWDGNIPWVSIVDTDPGPYIINTKKTVTPLGVSESSTAILPEETIVITARGTVGQTALMAYPMAMNQSCYGLRGKSIGQIYLLHQTRTLIERLKSNVHGSVFDTITRDAFNSLTVIQPPPCLMQRYEQLVRPMFNLIKSNQEQTVILGQLRDTLLPKLLSGELRVPVATEEGFIQEVASDGV